MVLLLEKDLAPKLSRTSNSLFLKVFILQKILYKHILYKLKIFIHLGYIDIKMEDWSFNLQKAARFCRNQTYSGFQFIKCFQNIKV